MLMVNNLEFSWNTNADQPIIGPISFSVSKGEILGVFGRSGTGKSTLLRLLKGELAPKKGIIDAIHNSHRIYHDQNQNLIPWLDAQDNVIINLKYFKKKPSREELNALLENFEITEYLGRDATRLSGGQRARVALARSLIEPSDILLLDEPFAGVDVRSQHSLVREITRDSSNRATLISSHDPGLLIEICDRVLCLVERRGRVLATEFSVDNTLLSLSARKRNKSKQYLPEIQRLLGKLYA